MNRTTVGLSVIVIVSLLLLVIAPTGPAALAQGDDKVGLVVKFGDGSVFTDCIDFSGPGMTGEDVLDLSGLPVVKDTSYGLGAAVCRIEEDGCDYPDEHCFCQCLGNECDYWAYYHLDRQGGEWVYSVKGSSWNTIQAGDVEGWAWYDDDLTEAENEPPVKTFEELCAPPTPTPTRTPEPVPPKVDFWADPPEIVAGQCSTLHWSVEHGELVALDGEGVRPDDARYLCLSSTQNFELMVFNGAGEFDYEVTITVRQPTATPYPTATHATPPTPTSGTTPPPPPPTETPIIEQPEVSTSPPPTETPTQPATPRPTVVAMLSTATATLAPEQTAAGSDPEEDSIAQSTVPAPAPAAPPDDPVGLDRILLLLGVGAGTLGFGTVAFVATVTLLLVIYFRARAQF
jgi:hypothetical protein